MHSRTCVSYLPASFCSLLVLTACGDEGGAGTSKGSDATQSESAATTLGSGTTTGGAATTAASGGTATSGVTSVSASSAGGMSFTAATTGGDQGTSGTNTTDGGTTTSTTGGGAATATGAGGAANTASTSGTMSTTTNGTTGGTVDGMLCEAMGWATRNGRNGGAVDVTGGGNAAPVVVNSFGDLQANAEGDQPRVIHVDGPVGSGWSGRSGDRLEVGSNKTIVGLRPGTELKAPIHVDGSSNVIIRNLVIKGPGSNSDQAWDNINIEGGSKNVWIDHCEFWDGQDGNADVVKGADNVTFTWNIFGYRTGGSHNFSNLVASSDDEPESEGKLNITLMFNWFTGVAQRQPRCRYGNIHVVNNLFTRDGQQSDYGISAGKDCKVLTENNHFIDINTPIYTNHASGSAANELRGNNIFENTSGNTQGFGTAFNPPYEYEHLLVDASEVKALVEQKVGATLQSPTDCD